MEDFLNMMQKLVHLKSFVLVTRIGTLYRSIRYTEFFWVWELTLIFFWSLLARFIFALSKKVSQKFNFFKLLDCLYKPRISVFLKFKN